jgi:hypothetical protein
MGLPNYPGTSGRHGSAFLRTIVDHCEAFSGEPILNHPFLGQTYYATLGEGRFIMGPDGEPCLLIWIHVDDLFVHCPTREKFNYLTGTEMRLGLICQPVKTSPPCQIQKFYGFLYDLKEAPYLHVLPDKLSRAQALVCYVLAGVK